MLFNVCMNTGEPLDVIYGNGMGRNFLFLSFKEQTGHSVKDATKVSPDSITKVPLQIEKEPENIWNARDMAGNNYQFSGITDSIRVDFFNHIRKESSKRFSYASSRQHKKSFFVFAL